MQPFFSVVIPTYNRADLILKTLDSVFNQSYKNFEIIIVDNCSTDNTQELLEPLVKTNKIKLITNITNLERSISRNVGFENASGNFLTLLDSDDLMYKDNLKDAAEFVLKNPDTFFFHNYYELINEKGQVLYKYHYPNLNDRLRAIADGNFISCIGTFLAKKIYTNYKFDANPDILGSEDWELWIRIIADYKIGVIPKVNNGILHHQGRSISQYTIESIIKRKQYIIEKIKADTHLYKIYKNYINRISCSSYIFAATMCNTGRMYDKSLHYLKIALKENLFCIFSFKFIRVFQIALFRIKHKHNI
jgi:glycosyltransferase involved in cell wall biosynthesis